MFFSQVFEPIIWEMINDFANDHFWQVTLPKLKPRRPFPVAAFCRKLHGKLTFLKRFSRQNQFSRGRHPYFYFALLLTDYTKMIMGSLRYGVN